MFTVLDLFSAAAGGWSLGLHRAGFRTIAACEVVEWRRILYSENNPDVRVYDDVRTLTAARLAADLGALPDIIVGSPPCQDISSANNAKGKGVDGARSGLFFEATRIIGECRPRWFALENSADLRTKGADRVLARLEGLGYASWPVVVRARDVGANHIRPRVWLLGCDPDQVVESAIGRVHGRPHALSQGGHEHAAGLGREGGRSWGRGPHGDGAPSVGPGSICPHGIRWPWACDDCDRATSDSKSVGRSAWSGFPRGPRGADEWHEPGDDAVHPDPAGDGHEGRSANAGKEAHRQPGRGSGLDADREGQSHGAGDAQVGGRSSPGRDAAGPWSQWNGGLAHHLRVDDGLSAWVAQSRIAVGGPKGTAAASLLVEAFGDAVLPQIPEAIGRAILRTEEALAAVSSPSLDIPAKEAC